MGRLMKGIFNLSANYEPLIAAPIDARTVVEYKEDLINVDTWRNGDGVYLYNGLCVAVVSDTAENNGLYFLKNASLYNNYESWVKFADQSAIESIYEKIAEIELASTSEVVSVPDRQSLPNLGKVNAVYFVIDENATYRWDNTQLKYYCVGRNYEEIKIIYGGDASTEI